MCQLILRHFLYIFVLLNFFALSSFASPNDSSVKTKWGYEGEIGPLNWGHLNSEFTLCATGKAQSPIDIPKNTIKKKYALAMNYHQTPFEIIDDGTSDLNIQGKKTITNNGHTIQINFHDQTIEEIIFSNDAYKLVQFHFHTPSENLLAGQSFPMEIHFVHQGNDGKVAVIGVFIKNGKANPSLQKIIDHLPKDVGVAHAITDVKINLYDLVPDHKPYFHFLGSLTTPPCSEGLQWIVMREPIEASPQQILQLQKAIGKQNARPTQPIDKREITYSSGIMEKK